MRRFYLVWIMMGLPWNYEHLAVCSCLNIKIAVFYFTLTSFRHSLTNLISLGLISQVVVMLKPAHASIMWRSLLTPKFTSSGISWQSSTNPEACPVVLENFYSFRKQPPCGFEVLTKGTISKDKVIPKCHTHHWYHDQWAFYYTLIRPFGAELLEVFRQGLAMESLQ